MKSIHFCPDFCLSMYQTYEVKNSQLSLRNNSKGLKRITILSTPVTFQIRILSRTPVPSPEKRADASLKFQSAARAPKNPAQRSLKKAPARAELALKRAKAGEDRAETPSDPHRASAPRGGLEARGCSRRGGRRARQPAPRSSSLRRMLQSRSVPISSSLLRLLRRRPLFCAFFLFSHPRGAQRKRGDTFLKWHFQMKKYRGEFASAGLLYGPGPPCAAMDWRGKWSSGAKCLSRLKWERCALPAGFFSVYVFDGVRVDFLRMRYDGMARDCFYWLQRVTYVSVSDGFIHFAYREIFLCIRFNGISMFIA